MKLDILTPRETKTFTIAWLELNTATGNMVVQRGHVPMIVNLMPNQPIIFRLKNGKQEIITPRQGVAEIDREEIRILMTEGE